MTKKIEKIGVSIDFYVKKLVTKKIAIAKSGTGKCEKGKLMRKYEVMGNYYRNI